LHLQLTPVFFSFAIPKGDLLGLLLLCCLFVIPKGDLLGLLPLFSCLSSPKGIAVAVAVAVAFPCCPGQAKPSAFALPLPLGYVLQSSHQNDAIADIQRIRKLSLA
jgi:hypothetical protein